MNSRLGVSPISSSHRFATPSPHRPGVPISDRFSIMRPSAPPRAAYFAAVLPVGPAPTTRTSTWRSICFGPIPSGLMRLWDQFGWKRRTTSDAAVAVVPRPPPPYTWGGRHGAEGGRILWGSVLTLAMEVENPKGQKMGDSSLAVSPPQNWA